MQQRDEIRSKLDAKALTRRDWDSIGKDKILQATVLDDIFKKYVDYQQLHHEHKAADWRAKRNTLHTLNSTHFADLIDQGQSPQAAGQVGPAGNWTHSRTPRA